MYNAGTDYLGKENLLILLGAFVGAFGMSFRFLSTELSDQGQLSDLRLVVV